MSIDRGKEEEKGEEKTSWFGLVDMVYGLGVAFWGWYVFHGCGVPVCP
jgi:hypothetical protein